MRTDSFEDALIRDIVDLRLFLAKRVGGRGPREDVLQETLRRALAGRDVFAGRTKLLTWLLGIACKVILEESRERKCLRLDERLDEVALDRDAGDALRPDRSLERAETLAIIHAAISARRPMHREILVWVLLEGRGPAEWARSRGKSLAATRSLLRRSRAALALDLARRLA